MPAVQFSDTNYNEGAATIELSGANHGIVHYDGAFAQTENGQTFTFSDFAHEQDVDDIYTLTAREIDFAGNETEQSITFSVNRFGSVYVLDDSLKDISNQLAEQTNINVQLNEQLNRQNQEIMQLKTNNENLENHYVQSRETKLRSQRHCFQLLEKYSIPDTQSVIPEIFIS